MPLTPLEEYVANLNESQLEQYEHIRTIVHEILPDIEETISYGIPTFKYKGAYVLYFGAFKNHMSVFPGAKVEIKGRLDGFKIAKGTIQFTAEKPLPDVIIRELITARLAMINSK